LNVGYLARGTKTDISESQSKIGCSAFLELFVDERRTQEV
jgi:hypothetical protein